MPNKDEKQIIKICKRFDCNTIEELKQHYVTTRILEYKYITILMLYNRLYDIMLKYCSEKEIRNGFFNELFHFPISKDTLFIEHTTRCIISVIRNILVIGENNEILIDLD
jgi:hypothetical protein